MRNITKEFSGVKALDRVSIELHDAEILAICGENGAGKSTLMKVLSGSHPQGTFEGSIVLEGKGVQLHSTRDAERHGIQMIYQEISLHLDLSVTENILLGDLPVGRLGFVNWPQAMEEAAKALRLVQLEVPLREKARNLSTSQHQLISIARACRRRPKILILDEPTSALTEREADNLFAILHELRHKGISCLYISHKMEEILRIADRITVLRDGRKVSTRNVGEVTKAQIIEDMLGRKIEALFPKEHAAIGKVILRVEDLRIPHPQNPNKDLLKGISFSVQRGEVLGLAGLVGSGRSELLDALFGIRTAGFSGKVFLDGKAVRVSSARQAQELGMGYLTEDRRRTGYVGTMDVAKNITLANLPALLRGVLLSRRREAEIARHYMKALTIHAPSERTSILQLSGGNQQKTVLAKWLNRKPALLLLDEPTRGIDVGAKAEIYRLISRLAQEGVAIILVTSEMPELIAMSDRIIVLAGGRIQAEFTREEVSQQEIMEAATRTAG